jgi:toxin ParE1/3/4
MRVELHPAAREEFHRAVDWYIAEAGKDTAARLTAEFEQLQLLVRTNPGSGMATGLEDSRRLLFRHFPYSLVYRVREDRIQIPALAHHSRKPDYWSGRS